MRKRTRLPWLVPALVGLIALVAVPWRGSGPEPASRNTPGASGVEAGGQPAPVTRNAGAERGGTVRFYLHMRPRDLNPHTAGYAAESQVTECLFESLLTPDRVAGSDPGRHRSRYRARHQSDRGNRRVFP